MSRRDWLALAVGCLCVACTRPVSAQGTVTPDHAFPTQNERVRLHISDQTGGPVGGAKVVVTYRPGSAVSREDEVGMTDSGGSIGWTPADAGLATITATWPGPGREVSTAATTVSVRYPGAPLDGVLIMTAAGLLLVVGSVIRIYRLLRLPALH